MAIVDLIMPKLGESIMEATILKWHKNIGDAVKMDETVLDIATDKVDSEVPSTAEGVIEEILFNVNDVVPIGTTIAKIKTSSAETVTASPQPQPVQQDGNNQRAANNAQHAAHDTNEEDVQVISTTINGPSQKNANGQNNSNRFYSPLVLNIAAREGINLNDLESIAGSGNEGRVTKKDILEYVSNRKTGKAPGAQTQVRTQQPTAVANEMQSDKQLQTTSYQLPTGYSGNVEIIEMDRMRKLIAKHMVDSKHTSPHVTSFSEADVTNLVMWRDRVKKEFEKREGEKITFTPLFIEAVVKCIKKYPWLSSSIDGDKLIIKKDINIGMATALPSGNLIVPVIKNADQLNLVGLTKQVNNLAAAARSGKLKPDDTTGGTFTLTNVGSFGSIMGTPIINQPQVAILAVGAIKKRPVVIETPMGDSIAIRHMMYLSMSYDHRIIDGALGATFLNAVAKELENFNPEREI